MEYFRRHIRILGDDCYRRLRNSKILIAGVGGLGSTVSELLVRFGVGELVIVDDGVIDEPDINRQILYGFEDIGKRKVDIAEERLKMITGKTQIEKRFERIDKDFKLPRGIDIAVDCLDNFETRYILDDLLCKANIPLVHAGVESYFFQLLIVDRERVKKLSDIFKNIKDKKEIEVLPTTVLIAASLEAFETVNFLCGKSNITGKLLIGDLNDYTVKLIELPQ